MGTLVDRVVTIWWIVTSGFVIWWIVTSGYVYDEWDIATSVYVSQMLWNCNTLSIASIRKQIGACFTFSDKATEISTRRQPSLDFQPQVFNAQRVNRTLRDTNWDEAVMIGTTGMSVGCQDHDRIQDLLCECHNAVTYASSTLYRAGMNTTGRDNTHLPWLHGYIRFIGLRCLAAKSTIEEPQTIQ